ncbi:MAG: AAA family ATPase [Clostridia bacterium]|nr:AAA family ATPase [Clostridia bacterium]
MKKRLILVTSPPASGKTYVSKQLAKSLQNIVYLDKDALVPLSKRIFIAANEEINRSSPFFEENIRNYEYDVILDIGFEALEYANLVLINAPFTREVRNNEYITRLKANLAKRDADLVVIWVETDIEVTRQRMAERNSPRDVWKLAHWDEYVATRDYTTPSIPALSDCLVKFYNSNNEQYTESMERITKFLLN